MPPQYQWLTWSAARQALAARLADPSMVFWVDAELKLYLAEALRTYNALCEVWNADFQFSAAPGTAWYNLSTLANSPRLRTLTDSDIYTILQYHLLEPPTGSGTWTGTSQFNLNDLQGALQRRRDELIQFGGCNVVNQGFLATTPNTRRVYFPDSTLEPRRARFVPDSGSPVTMTREDTAAWGAFEPAYLQTVKIPQAWSVIAGPPLAMDVDTAPNIAGKFDIISLQAGRQFTPPVPVLLGVPNDWAWVAKWGALADLLGRDSEATDRLRADYCLKRFMDGIQIMQQSNWLLSATINGVIVDTPSVRELDGYAAEWQENPNAWPGVVTAGMDLCAPCPVPTSLAVSVGTVLVGNAPIPVLDSDYVQVSRDVFDAVLDYAQRLATFKMGGSEFTDSVDLEKNFFSVCAQTNDRLKDMGLFPDELHSEGQRQDKTQPR